VGGRNPASPEVSKRCGVRGPHAVTTDTVDTAGAPLTQRLRPRSKSRAKERLGTERQGKGRAKPQQGQRDAKGGQPGRKTVTTNKSTWFLAALHTLFNLPQTASQLGALTTCASKLNIFECFVVFSTYAANDKSIPAVIPKMLFWPFHRKPPGRMNSRRGKLGQFRFH
jgi:hypothetical protein